MRPLLALLLLPACVETAPVDKGSPTEVGTDPVDEPDTAEADTAAEDPCAIPHGRVGFDTYEVVLAPGSESAVVTMLGLAAICEVSCSEAWLGATVGGYETTCATEAIALPWEMTRNGTFCLTASSPPAGAEGTCTVHTSVGDIDVTASWEG